MEGQTFNDDEFKLAVRSTVSVAKTRVWGVRALTDRTVTSVGQWALHNIKRVGFAVAYKAGCQGMAKLIQKMRWNRRRTLDRAPWEFFFYTRCKLTGANAAASMEVLWEAGGRSDSFYAYTQDQGWCKYINHTFVPLIDIESGDVVDDLGPIRDDGDESEVVFDFTTSDGGDDVAPEVIDMTGDEVSSEVIDMTGDDGDDGDDLTGDDGDHEVIDMTGDDE